MPVAVRELYRAVLCVEVDGKRRLHTSVQGLCEGPSVPAGEVQARGFSQAVQVQIPRSQGLQANLVPGGCGECDVKPGGGLVQREELLEG